MVKVNLINCAAVLMLAASLMACSNSEVSQPKSNDSAQQTQTKSDNNSDQSTQQSQNDKLPTAWNKQDLDLKTNGNVVYAVMQISKSGMDTKNANQVNLADLAKAPFKYVGNVSSIEGTAVIAQEYPPGGKESQEYANGGPVAEIVMVDSEEKSLTPVDYVLIGDMRDINVNDKIKIYGYVLGTAQVPNKLGGKTDQVFMIGTKAEKISN